MEAKEQTQRFQELIEQNKGILFKVARTYCQNEYDRKDLIQEMLIQIWQSLHKYNSAFKISTWLYRICINVAISYHRKSVIRVKKNVQLTEEAIQGKEDEKPEKELQLSMLNQFISELKELDKALILLYLEEKRHSEIAEILGISSGNVGTKIGRIKEKLKQRFLQQNV